MLAAVDSARSRPDLGIARSDAFPAHTQALRGLELTQCCSVCLLGPDRIVYKEVKVATFVSLQDVLNVKSLVAACRFWVPMTRLIRAPGELPLVHEQVENASPGVEEDLVAISNEANRTTDCCLGGDMKRDRAELGAISVRR